MCIILYIEAGKTVKDEWLDNSAGSNKDGFGLSYSRDGKVQIFKTMDYKEFKEKYRELESNLPDTSFILHFRKSTTGKIDITNCHPFLVGDKAVFHNGSISLCSPPKSDLERSDTRIFCEDILSDMPKGWVEFDGVLELIEGFIGKSKMVFMEDDGTVSILNEHSGHWVDGVWASNYSYYPNTKSVQKTKPMTWNANLKLITGGKGKGKNNEKNRGFLPVCYKHIDGYYTKYKNNLRFRWFPSMFMWSCINQEGYVNQANNSTEYSDPPTHSNYRIIDSEYPLFSSYSGTREVQQQVECDWCGQHSPKSQLGVFSWNEEHMEEMDDPDEKYLVCDTCMRSLGVEDLMTKVQNINLDYYLNMRGVSSLWSVV